MANHNNSKPGPRPNRRSGMAGLRIRPLDLARRVGRTLAARKLTLVTAESCTGGGIAEWLTRVPGSSGWFECGLVAYSNAAKAELLGVQPVTLKQHGAVSEATAREMAVGALQVRRTDLSVAVTGIAGPDGGTRSKPVGTVCLAWAGRNGEVLSTCIHLHGSRYAIRRQSVVLALLGVIDMAADRED